MTSLRVQYQTLAYLLGAAAVIAAILAIFPSYQQHFTGRTLAALASIAFCYVGYGMYFDRRGQFATVWQSFVWTATFLLTVGFLIRAIAVQGLL
jgi:hypothetical protein